MKTERLWGKRLAKGPSALAGRFTAGRDVRGIPPADERLIPYDLWGSRAHVCMLARQKILSRREARTLIRGLKEIEGLWQRGDFVLDPAKEDVHTNIESLLTEKYGIEVGGRLHTARSRNDQVALDMRLYLRDCSLRFSSALASLSEVLLSDIEERSQILLPGYTHHQPAQITSLGHVFLSFAEALMRDGRRFQDWYVRFNRNPLGSMTGYGTSFPIDRLLTSRLLGFDGPSRNSLDPIQNRWEPEAELAFAVCVLMNHLSSVAETLILFSSEEFALIRLDDAYCTGSSMMPQKRNPDTLEVMKAKAATAQGILTALISVGRSLFLGYNRDTQWTKYYIMDLVDETLPAPGVAAEILSSLQVNRMKAAALCEKGFIAAPDLLEELVQKEALPFRRAKVLVEKAVKYSEGKGAARVLPWALQKALQEDGLDLAIGEKMVDAAQDPKHIITRRKAIGGPSPKTASENARLLSQELRTLKGWLARKTAQLSSARSRLTEMERAL